MRFTTKPDAEAFFGARQKKTNGGRGASRFKAGNFHYVSRLTTAAEVSQALADAQGDFTECMVWPSALVWGDRSLEDPAPPDWAAYAQWRQKHGERRSLYEAPGHLFEAHERPELARLLEMAIYMGWDALVASRPFKASLELSHDDRVTIHARTRQAALVAKLEQLGMKRGD